MKPTEHYTEQPGLLEDKLRHLIAEAWSVTPDQVTTDAIREWRAELYDNASHQWEDDPYLESQNRTQIGAEAQLARTFLAQFGTHD